METPLFGNYRAKVIQNKDPLICGRVKVWIPDIMPDVEDTKGLWARPANNFAGGRNTENEADCHYAGSCFVPEKGSWVWIFLEAGNINKPYYFGALDLEHPADKPSVLPECQVGNYEKKWVIFKSHVGRCFVVSDDISDERVELTGKKRLIKEPPHGDADSVYVIDGNQTTILLDEQEGREKLLIRTRLGDYIHVDIEEQQLQCYFKNDIILQTDGNFQLKVKKDIKIESTGDTFIESKQNVHVKAGLSIFNEATAQIHRKAGSDIFDSAGATHHTKVVGNILRDGAAITDQNGGAVDAGPTLPAKPTVPAGQRDS